MQQAQGVENGSRAEEQLVVARSKRSLDQPDEPVKRQRTARTEVQGVIDVTKIEHEDANGPRKWSRSETRVLPTQQ